MATTKRRSKTPKPKKHTEAELREFLAQHQELAALRKQRADLDLKIVEAEAKLAMGRSPFALSGGPGACLVE